MKFVHDRRFERFRNGGIPRQLSGFLYWHFKYLKKGAGFATYDLDKYPKSRYSKKKCDFEASEVLTLPEFRVWMKQRHGFFRKLVSQVNDKRRLLMKRDLAVTEFFSHDSVEEALMELSTESAKFVLGCHSRN